MKPSSTLFRKHLINFVALAGLLLLACGAAVLYLSWQDSRDAFLNLQRERAEAAADGIAQRLSGLVHQIGASAPLQPGQDAIAHRTHEITVLRQLPGISDILLLDHEGRELLRMPRAGSQADGSKTDYSLSAAFQAARSGQPYISPVYSGGDHEPHITIAMAAGPEAGVTVAEIDLRFLLDGLSRIAASGPVYVADAHGQAIALADPELKLQKAGLAYPMADMDAQAMVAPLGWKVSIEAAPLSTLATLGVALLLAGLMMAATAGLMMANRMKRQVAVLRAKHEQLERRAAHFEHAAQDAQQEKQAAELAHTHLRDMIDALPLAVYQYREAANGESGFTFVSKNARGVLGVEAAAIMADKQARWRTTLPEDRVVIEPVLQQALAARQPVDSHQRVQVGGATRWVRSCTAMPRQVDRGWIWNGCWLDETTARRREEDMQKGREEAENLARARSAFLCNISQEIRAPLNSIIGLSQLALNVDLTAPQRDCIGKIHQAGTDLSAAINDILDFARIDAGKLVLASADFRLDHVIDNVAAAFGRAAAGKGLALTFSVPRSLPRALRGDPLRLEQILANLAGNAIKFTERGEVAVRVERVYSTDTHVMLRFVVRDTGIGMSDRQRERLFEMPPREGRAGANGSIGLGLIICRRLVDMMGGAIAVESRPGAGSTFCFTARFGLGTAEAQPDDGIDGMRVLLVEDNALNQQVVAELLEGAGAQVNVAGNGRIALEKLKSDAPFDVVLMDLQMPEMDGFEATATLRSDPALAELPVLALTAHGTQQDRARCIAAGMNDHLTKPVVPHVLIDALKRWGWRARQDRQGAAAAGRPQPEHAFWHTPPRVAAMKGGTPADGRAAGRISKETFQQLVGYLSSGDRVALDCFAAHRDELACALGRKVEQLEQAIGASDFETALGLLDNVMTRLDFGFGR
ncbi:hybrid sensor histidine kinase/response regulator [Noviherbaspirillum autotrophicum]|uniref:hybrid sensor histidine kinase/response regulator n=1 Tax=Noviherbaspirillum autotrophicum TaxID=709839 RepID=UPI00069408A1|nr:hybrid sensor histidine kinase/response regulator [Noviherbaspirillum autotrophicum]